MVFSIIGFQYALFDKESKTKVCDAQIDWTELEDSPIGNPLAAARNYIFADIGIEADTVTRVSVDILESFIDEQMAWKVGEDHYLILQTCDSKSYHWKYYKKLLEDNGLPDIRWHDLQSTFCTLLLKNAFTETLVDVL